MSCYLFTWHTYGSWLPDRPQGYVHWERGLSPPNAALAACYKEQQKESTLNLSLQQQEFIIDEILIAARHQRIRLHAIACEGSHVHVLASWKDKRPAKALRRSLRHSLTQKLNQLDKRSWFSRGGDLKRVRTQQHFDHLYHRYLPSHSGMKWNIEKGLYQ